MASKLVDDVISQIKADLEDYRPKYGDLVTVLQDEVNSARSSLDFQLTNMQLDITVLHGYWSYLVNFYERLPSTFQSEQEGHSILRPDMEKTIASLYSEDVIKKNFGEISNYLREKRSLSKNLPLEFYKEILLPIYVHLRSFGHNRNELIS